MPKAKTNSTRRIKAAAMAAEDAARTLSSSQKRRLRKKVSIRKKLKTADERRPLLHYNPKSSSVIVFDGSHGSEPTTKRPPSIRLQDWQSISIRNGGLTIVTPSTSDTGTKCPISSTKGSQTPFTMVARQKTLDTLQLKDEYHAIKLYQALQAVEKEQKVSTNRHCIILNDGDRNHKYAGGYGLTVNRNRTGISKSAVYKKSSQENVKILNKHAKGMEFLFRMYGDFKSVGVAEASTRVVNFPTIDGCKIYSGLATGTNTYLPVHIDKDFTSSIVMVLKSEACKEDDKEVAYFCFPELGVAVPLRPGDALIFNPREPHCLSSRCHVEDEVVCMSLYLKSAVVGLNDNSLPLTARQEELATLYDS